MRRTAGSGGRRESVVSVVLAAADGYTSTWLGGSTNEAMSGGPDAGGNTFGSFGLGVGMNKRSAPPSG